MCLLAISASFFQHQYSVLCQYHAHNVVAVSGNVAVIIRLCHWQSYFPLSVSMKSIFATYILKLNKLNTLLTHLFTGNKGWTRNKSRTK